jgi:ethanolamine utilization protein EutN
MLTATVIGSVWATRRLAELPNGAFLEVEAEGSGQGSVAAAWFPGKPPPVDALIIGSIDSEPVQTKAPRSKKGKVSDGG